MVQSRQSMIYHQVWQYYERASRVLGGRLNDSEMRSLSDLRTAQSGLTRLADRDRARKMELRVRLSLD